MRTLHTIGYQATTLNDFLDTLRGAGVERLIDIRRIASSRRPGFSKTRLAENLAGARIAYLHVRALGTPAEGRAAARSGRPDEMKRIFRAHLRTAEARDALHDLADIIESSRAVCLLCFEAEPEHCHRSLVAEAVALLVPVEVRHLRPGA